MANQTFSSAQIEALRTEFSKINTVNPDRLPQFHAMFAKMDDAALVQVAKAQIKFLSRLAINACTRRNIDILAA